MDTSPDATHDAITETRIAQVMALMEALEFKRAESVVELAAEWGITESAARNITAIASKRVRARVMDPDVVSAEVGTALRAVMRQGLANDDPKTVINAAKVWSEISGSSAPQRHEHTTESRLVIALPPDDDGRD